MEFGRKEHRAMFRWAQRTRLLDRMLAAGRSIGLTAPVILLATPDTKEGRYLDRTARLQKCADEVSRRFSAQRRAGVPRFLIGMTTVEAMLTTAMTDQARGDLERAAATGAVPAFIVDAGGYWCGTLVGGSAASVFG